MLAPSVLLSQQKQKHPAKRDAENLNSSMHACMLLHQQALDMTDLSANIVYLALFNLYFFF